MTNPSIADLAVLGIAGEGPIEPGRIATVVKSLAPEHWQPTTSVIDRTIEKNLAQGFLRCTGNRSTNRHLAITVEGVDKVRALLLCPSETLAPSAPLAAEAIQFCFLDTADDDIAGKILSRYRARLNDRLAAYERRSAQCPYGGRYTNFWMDMEQRRLESMVRFLAGVANDAAASGSEPLVMPEGTP